MRRTAWYIALGALACGIALAGCKSEKQTAWQIFVAANCPSNAGKVVWENWEEQLQIYPASGQASKTALAEGAPPPRLHGSPLAQIIARERHKRLRALGANLSSPCPPMQGPPPNVVPNASVCEETRLNPEAQAFVVNNSYQIRPGQTSAAQKGADIEFPSPSVEIKVDWIPASDFNPPFSCSQPPPGVHVETIDGTCYALAGMHISSKLLKNWLWATFEPQSMLTNPLRCITFGTCKDPWGSDPAISSGGANGFTKQTPALETLMKQANLSPEFLNYRLDGAQVDFMEADGKTATLLGNSIIEGENVGLTGGQASCITCHSSSSISKAGVDKGESLTAIVGTQYKIPAGWIARDFVWSLGIACPGGDKGIRPQESPCKVVATDQP